MAEDNNSVAYTFNLSKLAGEKIKDQLEKRGTPNSSLRLGIKGGGCSGYNYVIKFEDQEPKEKDLVFNLEGVTLIIDKKSIIYLNGSTLDWEKSLLKQGFKFVNPNEKASCGCGHSFSV
jgi:iron-sulfur cluster assembly protein